MRFIQFILSNLLRFKYLGILLLAFLPIIFLDNKAIFVQTGGEYHYPAQIIYILCAVVCFLLFSVRFTAQVSCVIVLSLFYNFLFLQTKHELPVDFLFMSFFYLSIHVILLNRARLRYVIPVLLGIVAMLKTIGLSLLLSYLFYLIVFRLQTTKQKMVGVGVTLLIVALTVFAFQLLLPLEINRYLLEASGYPELRHYDADLFHFGSDMPNIMLYKNLETYPGYILNFFEQSLPDVIQLTIQVVCVILFFIGVYFSVKNQFGFIDVAFCLCDLPVFTARKRVQAVFACGALVFLLHGQ